MHYGKGFQPPLALGPILSRPGTRHSRTPGRPRAFDTPWRVFESGMDEFIVKDEAFVEQWLVRHGQDKFVDVWGIFPSTVQASYRLVSSLLYGTRVMLVLNLPAFENKKNTRFHGNSPYGGILTKKDPIRTLGFTLPYNKGIYFPIFSFIRSWLKSDIGEYSVAGP